MHSNTTSGGSTNEDHYRRVAAGQVLDGLPILLDLDGDGIEITELDRSTTFMDASGSGLKHRTAWAGKGDGVLFYDADNDGLISDDREYIFTEWDPTAGDDLAALRSRFDTTDDGKLSGTELANFNVMVTNVNGSQSVQTLAALGITELRLNPDTTRIRMADSSAITGQATFLQGGVTQVLANLTLPTEARATRVVEGAPMVAGGVPTTTKGGGGAENRMEIHCKSAATRLPADMPVNRTTILWRIAS